MFCIYFNIVIKSLRISFNVFLPYLPPTLLRIPSRSTPDVVFFLSLLFSNNTSSSICAAHVLLEVGPATGAWLTYRDGREQTYRKLIVPSPEATNCTYLLSYLWGQQTPASHRKKADCLILCMFLFFFRQVTAAVSS